MNINEQSHTQNNDSDSVRRSGRARVPTKPYAASMYAHFAQCALMSAEDPVSYKDALSRSDASEWRGAIDEELKAQAKNNTVETQKDMNVIGSRWVFTKKKDANGKVLRYKGRLVAKGSALHHSCYHHS